MADAILAFRHRHPAVTLQFTSASSTPRCVELVHAGQADLAWITLGEPLSGIEHRPVTSLAWVLVVRAGDPLAARHSIGPGDLAGIRYIAYPEGSASRQRLEENFVRLGISRPDPVGVADWDTAILLAELGIGHAIVPELPRLMALLDSPLRAVPIPALSPLAVGWAARRWDALSPLATEFAELVTARHQTP
jgi:DNA-binding transcriptional LysR family regulator